MTLGFIFLTEQANDILRLRRITNARTGFHATANTNGGKPTKRTKQLARTLRTTSQIGHLAIFFYVEVKCVKHNSSTIFIIKLLVSVLLKSRGEEADFH